MVQVSIDFFGTGKIIRIESFIQQVIYGLVGHRAFWKIAGFQELIISFDRADDFQSFFADGDPLSLSFLPVKVISAGVIAEPFIAAAFDLLAAVFTNRFLQVAHYSKLTKRLTSK